MTAGRGILHAEQPRRDDPKNDPEDALTEELQLWIDMPKELKYVAPRYRDARAQDIPIAKVDDGRVIVKVITGESHGVVSEHDLAYTPIWYLDLTIMPGGHVQQAVPQGWNVLPYTLRG
jgi:redox-sensitive bicupin YhaK (pirin superfamily)